MYVRNILAGDRIGTYEAREMLSRAARVYPRETTGIATLKDGGQRSRPRKDVLLNLQGICARYGTRQNIALCCAADHPRVGTIQ